MEEKSRTGETLLGYNVTGSEPVPVHLGEAERRIISAIAAKSGRTIEDQIKEMVLENLIGRLKEEK